MPHTISDTPTPALSIDHTDVVAVNDAVRRDFAHWTPDDVLIKVVTDPHPEAPAAWFNTHTADVSLNIDQIASLTRSDLPSVGAAIHNVATSMVPSNPQKDRQRRALIGLILHETAHAAWSTWGEDPVLHGASNATIAIMQMFEELRVEKMAVDHAGIKLPVSGPKDVFPALFSYLVHEIIDNLDTSSAASVAWTWALTCGRALNGSIKWDDVSGVDEVIRSLIGDEEVGWLHEILSEAVALDTSRPGALKRYRELAEEWLSLLPESEDDGAGSGDGDGDGEGAGSACGTQIGAGASEGEGDGDDDGDGEGDGEGDGDATTTISHGYSPPSDSFKKRLKQELVKSGAVWQPTPKERTPMEPMVVAPRVFGDKPMAPARVGGDGRGWRTSPPSTQVRQAIKELARELEQVAMPQLIKTETRVALPPGRLHSREAVRRSAEISRGAMVSAQPWKTAKRRHTTAKPLTVGVMTDTSGSMGWAEDMVAEAAFVFSHAGHRIGARAAAVTFGDKAEGVVAPRELPTAIRTRRANGGSEAFDEAAAAMDGVLNLSYDNGSAKFIVVVSDAYLVAPGEIDMAKEWISRWSKAGTRVVWVVPDSGRYSSLDWLRQTDATILPIDNREVARDALQLVRKLSPAIKKALRPDL